MTLAINPQAQFMRQLEASLSNIAKAAGAFAEAIEAAAGLSDQVAVVDLPEVRGHRQQQIVDLLSRVETESGIKTAEISRDIDMEQPNTYLTLQNLAKQGVVELVPNVEPQHWRLAQRYRYSRKIMDVAGLVREGEWTSYGDISQVVYGHFRGGLAVGQVAARLDEFPNPHRVLLYTGQVPEHWNDRNGNGPEHCAALLRAEGVEVDEGLFAHGRHHVDHEQLAQRFLNKFGGDV